MSTAPLIVCERHPAWAAAIRRAWGEQQGKALPLVETRHLEELQADLLTHPAAFVLVAADARNAARLPGLLEGIEARHHDAAFAVAAPRTWRAWGALWRAMGACQVVFSPRQLGPLLRMIARHRARFARPTTSWAAAGIALPWEGA